MNKMKITFILLFINIAVSAVIPASVSAEEVLFAQNSAVIATVSEKPDFLVSTVKISDTRALRLRNFLSGHKSPMADYSAEFIYFADKYELDWRLVPAIAGVESTFGKHIPVNSYNAYGWAGGKYMFKSWEHSIEVVTKALREKYYDKGADTLAEINRIYCPPNPKWAGKVSFFMEKIDPHPIEFTI